MASGGFWGRFSLKFSIKKISPKSRLSQADVVHFIQYFQVVNQFFYQSKKSGTIDDSFFEARENKNCLSVRSS